MPNKCGVIHCRGNYNEANKCRVFKMSKDELKRQNWVAVLLPRENFVVDPAKMFICEEHWPSDSPMVKLPGKFTRPATAPIIFKMPTSCLPASKPPPQPLKQEDKQLEYFQHIDNITSLSDFVPKKELHSKYDNVISRSTEKCVCIFIFSDYQEFKLTVIVYKNTGTQADSCLPIQHLHCEGSCRYY